MRLYKQKRAATGKTTHVQPRMAFTITHLLHSRATRSQSYTSTPGGSRALTGTGLS